MEVQTEMAKLKSVQADAAASKAGKAKLVAAKTVVTAKATADNQELSIKDKWSKLKADGQTTLGLLDAEDHPKKESMQKDINSAMKAADVFFTASLKRFAEHYDKVFAASVVEVKPQELKEVKLKLAEVGRDVAAEISVYKTSRCTIDTIAKQVQIFARRKTSAGKVSKQEEEELVNRSSDAQASNPLMSAGLAVSASAISPLLSDVTEVAAAFPSCMAVKSSRLETWCVGFKVTSYYKSQKAFLTKWLSQNKTFTTQEVTITVRVLKDEIAAIASDFLPSPMVGSAEFKAPKRKADAPEWHKSFEKSVYMASSHCAVGPSGFGLGEMIFGIEGFGLTLYGW